MSMQINGATYVIVLQLLDNEHTRFRLQKIGTEEFIEKTAAAIVLDQEIFKSLSKQDAYLIGYVCASEKTFLDIRSLRDIKLNA